MHIQPYSHDDTFHNNTINLHMMTSLQPWSTPWKWNKHMDCNHKKHICNRHECMTSAPPIQSKEWTMLWYHSIVSDMTQRECKLLWYHSITPSSHIYPSNQPSGVNMWWEATMIWFDLLSHVKEVELTETHHKNVQHQLQDPQEPIQCFRQLAFGSH